MRKWQGIVLHCSASPWGNALVIDEWHRNREPIPFRECGYHFIILNGRPSPGVKMDYCNGMIETGRSIQEDGAGALGYNETHVQVCMVGPPFTECQLNELWHLQCALSDEGIIPKEINKRTMLGHYETYKGKPKKKCPLLDMDDVREFMIDWGVRPNLNHYKK